MAPSCTLDADGLRAQLGRYRTVGRGAVLVEQTPRRLVVEVGRTVDAHLIEELLAVERECCPFFSLDWCPEQRRLAVSVSAAEQEPALDAVASALDVQASA
jgi:hypothetical protein